ncbi:MAG TPA: hypothetical protein ENH25_07350 [candidate division Zixibacteria bacterium]|nr:hypothetical protein [candidate division Zixibacteria bacterium]
MPIFIVLCIYDNTAGDFFDKRIVRSINVDIRYVLYLIDRVYHLEALLNELTVH